MKVDEFFVDPAHCSTAASIANQSPGGRGPCAPHRELFDGWTEADFDELHSRVGTGGALTVEGTLDAVRQMNRKRELHEKLDLLLESSQAEVAAGILNVLYREGRGGEWTVGRS